MTDPSALAIYERVSALIEIRLKAANGLGRKRTLSLADVMPRLSDVAGGKQSVFFYKRPSPGANIRVGCMTTFALAARVGPDYCIRFARKDTTRPFPEDVFPPLRRWYEHHTLIGVKPGHEAKARKLWSRWASTRSTIRLSAAELDAVLEVWAETAEVGP